VEAKGRFRSVIGHSARSFVLLPVSFLVASAASIGSAMGHLFTRLGFLCRTRSSRRLSRAVLDRLFVDSMPTTTVLVPSRGDDVEEVRSALLSAALQECPDTRIVLVIEDPTPTSDPGKVTTLTAVRDLPHQINELLAAPRAIFTRTLEAFESRVSPTYKPDGTEVRRLSNTYELAAAWLEQLAIDEEKHGHVDDCLVDKVVRSLASDLRTVAASLYAMPNEGTTVNVDRMHQLYRRLAWTFRAQVTSFEGQQCGAISVEPKETTTLSSYIGLMGGQYRRKLVDGCPTLISTDARAAELSIPEPDYVLVVEPGSLLRPEYCLRMVHLLQRQRKEGVATAPNLLSTLPGAGNRFQRIANARTEITAHSNAA
jgi:cellulose synthase (UDP-forming)